MPWLWLTFSSGWAETDDSFQKQLWRNVPRLIIKEEKFKTMVSRSHDCSVAIDAPLLCPHYWYLSRIYHCLSCGSSLEDWQYILLFFNFQGSGIEGRRRGATKDEMVGWHQRLHGREFEQTPADSEGRGSLVRCSPWGHKELDTTWMNNK